jgi:predicted SAM-dependent methyltransferase
MKLNLVNFIKNFIPFGVVKYIAKKKYYKNFGFKKRNEKSKLDDIHKLNLCSGPVIIENYINLDISPNSDIIVNLENQNLPFENDRFNTVICMSAINYFEKQRAIEILYDVHRVLIKGGILRISTQCLDKLLKYYIDNDENFFNQKNEKNLPRFPGNNNAEKLLNWFYGFETVEGHKTKYIYNYEILSNILKEIGFKNISNKNFLESQLVDIKKIDNRADQCFFIECKK